MSKAADIAGGIVVSWDDLGYVPVTRVIGRFGYSGGKITNVVIADVVTYSDRIVIGDMSSLQELFYFVFTKRTA